jgi:hypothetical protein
MAHIIKQTDVNKIIHGQFDMLYNDVAECDPHHKCFVDMYHKLNDRIKLNDEFDGVFPKGQPTWFYLEDSPFTKGEVLFDGKSCAEVMKKGREAWA